MKEGNLFTDDVGEFDEVGVEGVDATFGEVFEEAAQCNEMIGLGDGLEVFAIAVNFAVKLEAIFAKKFGGDINWFEVAGLFGFANFEIGILIENI